MFDIALRDVKEAVCAPVARVLGRVFTPTQVTVLGFFCGLMSVLFVSWGWFVAGNVCWYLNRFLDGVDGVVARLQNKQSDFGGYVDILCDFVVYALVPIALCVALTDALAPLDAVALVQRDSIVHTLLPDLVPRDISMRSLFVILALLESTYFVNAASQMFLASILEKRAQGAKANGELTTITMPVGLIEGAETMVVYSLWLLFPQRAPLLFCLFGLGVTANIVYRLVYATRKLVDHEPLDHHHHQVPKL